jgi:hypothetical protein
MIAASFSYEALDDFVGFSPVTLDMEIFRGIPCSWRLQSENWHLRHCDCRRQESEGDHE